MFSKIAQKSNPKINTRNYSQLKNQESLNEIKKTMNPIIELTSCGIIVQTLDYNTILEIERYNKNRFDISNLIDEEYITSLKTILRDLEDTFRYKNIVYIGKETNQEKVLSYIKDEINTAKEFQERLNSKFKIISACHGKYISIDYNKP